jgi:hypothetical protein
MNESDYFVIPIIDTSSGTPVTIEVIKLVGDVCFGDCKKVAYDYVKQYHLTGSIRYKVMISPQPIIPTMMCTVTRAEERKKDECSFEKVKEETNENICILSQSRS